jgi:hypothetical protein
LLPSYLLFFVPCLFYLWLVVEPHLVYYGFGTLLPDSPQFATGWPFLKETLNEPGGPIAYVTGFLSLGYYYSWLGALIIVLAGLSLTELGRRHLVAAGLGRAAFLALVPAILFFLICSRYNHPLNICVAVSLGLLLSLAWESLPRHRPGTRAVACGLVAVIGFWLGGAGTWLIFALTAAIRSVFLPPLSAHAGVQRWRVLGTLAALAASAAIAWGLTEYAFLIPAHEATLILTPWASAARTGMDSVLSVLLLLLYGFVPAVVLLGLVARSLLRRRRPKPVKKRRPRAGAASHKTVRFRLSPGVLRLGPGALALGLTALGLCAVHQQLRKPYLLSNSYARECEWDKILDLSRRLPKGKTNPFVNHDLMRALYHTGRLPYDLFRYPVIPEALLLTHEKKVSELTEWKLSEIFLELGYVNLAQKLASELLATQGRFAPALEELGWINAIKGQSATARVYWQALRKNPLYHRRARTLLEGLDRGFGPEEATYLETIRARRASEPAAITGNEPVDEVLAALLKHNPHNRMAFEYLMACYLLTGQVDKVTAEADRLRDLGYRTIPTLYEEAILIHYGSQGKAVDLARFDISPETLQRYEAFVRAAGAAQSSRDAAAFHDLIRNFGTSYFFYYSFGRVGLL